MANEKIQRYIFVREMSGHEENCGCYAELEPVPEEEFKSADDSGYVLYTDHLAATTDLREGQMHLAMELERKDEQIRKLREALENQIKYCSNGMIHTTALAALKAGE